MMLLRFLQYLFLFQDGRLLAAFLASLGDAFHFLQLLLRDQVQETAKYVYEEHATAADDYVGDGRRF